MNLACLLERAAGDHPDRIALRSGDVEVTYGALADQSARFGAFLRANGLETGDRVGIWAPNRLEYLAVVFGAWWAGGIAVPLNHFFPAAPLRHAVLDSGVRWVLSGSGDDAQLRDVLAGEPIAERLLTFDDDFPRIVAEHAPLAEVVPRMDGDEALLMYTSGSTGTPKGVRQTHRNAAAQTAAVIDAWEITGEDHILSSMPLFHVGGLHLCSLPLLARGGQITFMGKWDADAWIELVQTLRPTIGGLISTMLIDVGNRTREAPVGLDSLRICMFGGSRTPPAPLERFVSGTGVDAIIEIYGQTEQNGLSVTYRPGEARRDGSMGRPLSQIIRHQLVAPGGEDVVDPTSGQVGELWVRGDAVSPGYWNLPELTEQRFAGGWFRTGDLVSGDADGYLYYADRIDDMIVSGGENVYPQMVEAHLAACPLIAELAVIGTADERLVEKVTAIVVPVDADVTAEGIARWCDEQPDLRRLHRPRRIELVDELPRVGSGKLDRPAVRRMFA